jgi:hypothetical protein
MIVFIYYYYLRLAATQKPAFFTAIFDTYNKFLMSQKRVCSIFNSLFWEDFISAMSGFLRFKSMNIGPSVQSPYF